jgi:hypothetical protein
MTTVNRRVSRRTLPMLLNPLIPANAGIQEPGTPAVIGSWVPAFAGTNGGRGEWAADGRTKK